MREGRLDRDAPEAESRLRPTIRFSYVFSFAAVAAALGSLIPSHRTAAFGAVLIVVALPLLNARPVLWIALAVTVAWTSRLLTTTGLAPRFLDFMDFPLVFMGFLTAGVGHLDSVRRLPSAQRRVCVWTAVAAVVMAISWAFNDPAEPLRLLAAWVLALEPFLLLVAVLIMPMHPGDRRLLTAVTVTLLCGQLVFSAVQIFGGSVADSVKGTLLEAGAGHHVSAAGLVLGFFLLVGLRVRKAALVCFGIAALVVCVIADAKQVLFLLPLALLVLGVVQSSQTPGSSTLRGLIAGGAMSAVATFAILSYRSSSTALFFIDRTTTNDTGKFAVLSALWHDVTSNPATFVFGLGPGESVSRFAFLTTPDLLKSGSPVALLGLHASRGADRFNTIAFGGRFSGQSSFTSAQSSALGVLGDYGVVGMLVFAILIAAILAALYSSRDSLRASAFASWALLLPLAVIFDWLEQPPFTLSVMILTGLALRGPRSMRPDPVPLTGRRPRARPAARRAAHRRGRRPRPVDRDGAPTVP